MCLWSFFFRDHGLVRAFLLASSVSLSYYFQIHKGLPKPLYKWHVFYVTFDVWVIVIHQYFVKQLKVKQYKWRSMKIYGKKSKNIPHLVPSAKYQTWAALGNQSFLVIVYTKKENMNYQKSNKSIHKTLCPNFNPNTQGLFLYMFNFRGKYRDIIFQIFINKIDKIFINIVKIIITFISQILKVE